MATESISGLVSVIVLTYNHAAFVRETVESVLAQTHENIEIIISDDGSVDGTQEILKEYARRFAGKINLILSESNTGIPANVNRGLAVARGEYIAWLGGDDVMLPQKIAKQVQLLRSRPDAVGCCHDAEVFEWPSGKVLGRFSELCSGAKGLREGGVELWFDATYRMLPSAVMYRAAARPPHGFDERLRFANDWLFDIELFRHGKCAVVNEVLVRYRRHGKNVADNTLAKRTALEEVLLVLALIDARYPELHRLVRKRRTAFFLTEAARCYARGERRRFRAFTRMAIGSGAILRGLGLFLMLPLTGRFVSKYIATYPLRRPTWFVKLYSAFLH